MDIQKLVKIVGSRIPDVDEMMKMGEWWYYEFIKRGLLEEGMTVLDYGAGLGRLSIPFNRMADVTALDGNPEMVEYMKSQGVNAELRADLQGYEGQFDFVITAYVLQHNAFEKSRGIVKDMARLTDKLYFTFPTYEHFERTGREVPPRYDEYDKVETLELTKSDTTSRMIHEDDLPKLFEGSDWNIETLRPINMKKTLVWGISK